MAQPYLGEIRMFAGNFAPTGWMFCEGQLLPISENDALFVLLGTTYGGDGQSTFALPDLRGRIPIHQGNSNFGTTYVVGQTGGVEEITLTASQIPNHAHPLLASTSPGASSNPTNHVVASSGNVGLYIEDAASENLSPLAISAVGGSQPHTNFQPYLCVSFIISLFGLFPSQT